MITPLLRLFNVLLAIYFIFFFDIQPLGFIIAAISIFQTVRSYLPGKEQTVYHLVDCKHAHHNKDGHTHKAGNLTKQHELNKGHRH